VAERFGSGPVTDDEKSGSDYIPRLWASRKAGALARDIRLHGQTPELVAALKELALRYGVLTEYTSYLVQEPNAVATGREDMPRPAPAAPKDQAGAGAVSRSLAEARAATQSVVVPDRQEMDDLLRGHPGINPTRRAGGRIFILRAEVWTDLGHTDSLPVVSVAPFSDAYFALLRAIPELAQPASLTPAVLVAGRRVSVKIAAGGKASWRTGELEALVRDFRS
jgi:Ca-activated chloride channel family protein